MIAEPRITRGLITLPRALRMAAIVIAIAAIADPVVSRSQPVKPDIALRAVHASDRALADRAEQALRTNFVVLRDSSRVAGAYTGVAPLLLIGAAVPADLATSMDSYTPGRVFAVTPTRAAPSAAITNVVAPARTSLEAPVHVVVDANAVATAGDSLVVMLRDGTTLVDRATVALAGGEQRIAVPLQFTPARSGVAHLSASAMVQTRSERLSTATTRGASTDTRATAERERASVDFTVQVDLHRSNVLVYDARPSWMSTFVRRALANDARMMVTSRVVTRRVADGRDISTDVGRPPFDLGNAASMAAYDAIVIGAPDALSARDVQGLQTFMTSRGGSVLLLFDQRGTGAYERLMGDVSWVMHSDPVARVFGPALLRAGEWMAPRQLPPDAIPLLVAASSSAAERKAAAVDASVANAPAANAPATNASAANAPATKAPATNALPANAPAVVWKRFVGAGTLVVSGALDAWKYRDSTQSAFARYWRDLTASLAADAVPRVLVSVIPQVVHAGDPVTVRAVVRDLAEPRIAALGVGARGTDFSAALGERGTSPLRPWPSGAAGTVEAVANAPRRSGDWRASVAVSGPAGVGDGRVGNTGVGTTGVGDARVGDAGNGAEPTQHVQGTTSGARDDLGAMLWVVPDAQPIGRPHAIEPGHLGLLTRATGGFAVPESALASLSSRLQQTLGPVQRVRPSYPMRSPWWIIPFAGLLSAEWWVRRNRGLA